MRVRPNPVPGTSPSKDVRRSIQLSLLRDLRLVMPTGAPTTLNEELMVKVEAFLKSPYFNLKRLTTEQVSEKQAQNIKDYSKTFGGSIRKARSLLNSLCLKLPPGGVICMSAGQTKKNNNIPVYFHFSPPETVRVYEYCRLRGAN